MPSRRGRLPPASAIRAAQALYAPTSERTRHDPVRLEERQIADARGDIGQPYRVVGKLDRMLERGDITVAMRDAGEEFGRIYRLAALHPLRAADLAREVRHAAWAPTHATEQARRYRDRAIAAMGGHASPAGLCAWYVLGEEMTLREWARREGWNGRRLSEAAAKGILLGALGVLADFFGYTEKSG